MSGAHCNLNTSCECCAEVNACKRKHKDNSVNPRCNYIVCQYLYSCLALLAQHSPSMCLYGFPYGSHPIQLLFQRPFPLSLPALGPAKCDSIGANWKNPCREPSHFLILEGAFTAANVHSFWGHFQSAAGLSLLGLSPFQTEHSRPSMAICSLLNLHPKPQSQAL